MKTCCSITFRAVDGLPSPPHFIGHPKDHDTAGPIGKTASVFTRQLEIILWALPWLEVEKLALQIIGNAGIQPIKQSQYLCRIRNTHTSHLSAIGLGLIE